MTKFINIAYISKVNIANLNSGEGTGGNITSIKKITDFEGNSYSYISGQALRRYMKETLQQLGNSISSVDESGNPTFLPHEDTDNIKKWFDGMLKGKKNGKQDEVFKKYIDLDLFGYMYPKGERRWSPIKVSPMIACNYFKGENDYLTRKQLNKEGTKSGNIVQTEIETLNFYRGNIIIDNEAVGTDINEYTYEKTKLLSDEEKKQRINNIIEMVKNLNGGSKTARMLEDISPKFIIGVKQNTGNPFLLNTIKVDESNNINIDEIIENLKDYEYIIGKNKENIIVGISVGIFSNENSIKENFKQFGIEVIGVNKALDALKI